MLIPPLPSARAATEADSAKQFKMSPPTRMKMHSSTSFSKPLRGEIEHEHPTYNNTFLRARADRREK